MFAGRLRKITSADLAKREAMVTLAKHLEAGELTPVVDRRSGQQMDGRR
jgi:hypothetical protein